MFLLAVAAYPLLLGVLSLGLGLLAERATGARLPGALLPPIGFALLICICQLGTQVAWTAPLTAPLLAIVALVGLVLGRRRVRETARAAVVPLVAAAGVYVIFAAPAIFAGQPEFTSYGVDTTPPIHWLGAAHLASRGHDFAGGAASAALNLSAGYFNQSYPPGGNAALGVTARLSGVDIPWLFLPFLAFTAAMLSLSVFSIARGLVARRELAAVVAFVAAQPALLYGFLLQGQIKEVLAAYTVALLAALVPVYARTLGAGWRAGLPLAITGAAGMAATGVGFAAWLGPAALLALVVLVRASWTNERRQVFIGAGAFAVALLILALPSVLGMRVYFQSVSNLISNEVPLGSLLTPLSPLQTAGIWWSGDYRLPIQRDPGLNLALIGLVAAGVALTVEWSIRRRAWPAIVYFAIAVPGCLLLAKQGTPWIDVKAMIIAAPLVLLLALIGGVGVLSETPVRIAGIALTAAISLGVLVSNALLYHGTSLAPTKRYQELERIGERFAGEGPTLRPDFDDYALYFTRRMDPDAPGDARPVRPIGLNSPAPVSYGVSLRLDQLAPAYIQQFPTLLVQRSAFESRPPANFRRAYEGEYYDVWKRGAGEVLEHLGGGSTWAPAGTLRCTDVRRLARRARRENLTLAVSAAPDIAVAHVGNLRLPRNWSRSPADPEVLGTAGQGRLETTIRAPRAGEYDLWLAGSFTRTVRASVDGREVGSLTDEIKYAGLSQLVGRLHLDAGVHDLRIDRAGGNLAPGNGAGGAIGPAALTPVGERPTVTSLDPNDYREACERPVDWVELVRGVTLS